MAEGITNAQKMNGRIVTSTVTLTDAQKTMSDTKYLEKGIWLVTAAVSIGPTVTVQTELYDYSVIDGNIGLSCYLAKTTGATWAFQGRVLAINLTASKNVTITHSLNTGSFASNFGSASHQVQFIKVG